MIKPHVPKPEKKKELPNAEKALPDLAVKIANALLTDVLKAKLDNVVTAKKFLLEEHPKELKMVEKALRSLAARLTAYADKLEG